MLIVSGLGGRFGRGVSVPAGVSVQGGGPGLVKCLKEEWPRVIAKAVDLDPARSADDNARDLFAELAVPGGRLEIGYPDGRRTIFRTEAAELDPGLPARDALPEGAVVLATGGARGITAEALRPLARSGVTLVLVGRTPLPGSEDARYADVPADRLRGRLIEAARDAGEKPTPAGIERQLQALLRDREIRANLRISPPLAQGSSIAPRISPARRGGSARCRHLPGVRAAGRGHPRRRSGRGQALVDKDAASWSRVVETKALGAFVLARAVRPETLRFSVLFGSVAGRYGNSGQSDYAAANELLNRLAWRLHGEWPDSVKIAVSTGAPGRARGTGAGMVSAETGASSRRSR